MVSVLIHILYMATLPVSSRTYTSCPFTLPFAGVLEVFRGSLLFATPLVATEKGGIVGQDQSVEHRTPIAQSPPPQQQSSLRVPIVSGPSKLVESLRGCGGSALEGRICSGGVMTVMTLTTHYCHLMRPQAGLEGSISVWAGQLWATFCFVNLVPHATSATRSKKSRRSPRALWRWEFGGRLFQPHRYLLVR